MMAGWRAARRKLGRVVGRALRRRPANRLVHHARFVGEIAIKARDCGTIETDDVRQHDADRDSMRDAIMSRERVGAGMASAQHRAFDSDAGKVGSQLHGATRWQIVRLLKHAFEATLGSSSRRGFTGKRHRERISARGDIGFHCMRDRVDAL